MHMTETGDLRRLLADAGDVVDGMNVSSSKHNQTVPVACLARCLRLAEGMLLLQDSGFSDLVGAMLRLSLETWFLGVAVLIGAEEALPKVWGDFSRNLKLVGGPIQVALDSDHLKWQSFMSRTLELMDQRDPFPQHKEAAALFYRWFRWLCTWEGHGSVGAVLGHIQVGDDGEYRITLGRQNRKTEIFIPLGLALAGVLGTLLADEREISDEPFEDLVDAALANRSLRELMEQGLS